MEGEINIQTKQSLKVFINKICKFILLEFLLIVILLLTPVRELFGTSLFMLTKIIYIIYSSTLIWILYIILKYFKEVNDFINKYFSSLLYTFSILIAVLSGVLYLGYLKEFVIPDFLYCAYYDEYNYKLYSFEEGCQELIVLEKQYDDNEKLIYLKYNIDHRTFERFYKGGLIIKTIEKNNETLMIEEQLPFIYDEIIITTHYEYKETEFHQSREINYLVNGKVVVTQSGFYSAVHSEAELSAYLYDIKIEKFLSKPQLLVSKENLLSQVYTQSYINDKLSSPIPIDAKDYVDKFIYYVDLMYEVDLSETLRVSRSGILNNVRGHHFGYLDYWYVDEEVDAWHEYDSTLSIEMYLEDYTSNYYRYKNKLLTRLKINHVFDLSIGCNESLNYCDASLNSNSGPKIFRYLITQDNPIKKVEVYYLYGNNLLKDPKVIDKKELYLKGNKLFPQYAPFDDYYVQTLELFEEPKPYIKIK